MLIGALKALFPASELFLSRLRWSGFMSPEGHVVCGVSMIDVTAE